VSAGSPTGFEGRAADWLGVAEATRRILAHADTLERERVPLLASLGRALAEDVHATATLPPWDNSAMDGYAVRAADVRGAGRERSVALTVVGRLRAGDAPSAPVAAGQAVRIMTGAPLPLGADTVVRVEDTDAEAEPGTVRVLDDRDAGRNVRPGGEDMRRGDLVLREGAAVRVGTIGVLAALGRDVVPVRRQPRVAILSTGDELRTPDRYDDVREGVGVPESNGPMTAAAVLAAGGVPVPLGIAPDDPAAIRDAIRRAEGADALVTVGGASMGEADLVKRVLDAEGFRQDFWRVRMRPGSPLGFGRLPQGGGQAVFSLPGNPSSAFVTFELFVRPWLLRLAGHREVLRPRLACVAGERLSGATGLAVFLRVAVDVHADPPRVATTGPQGSGLVGGLASAGGLAVVPEGVGTIEAGEPVQVILLDAGPAAPAALAGPTGAS
jgi:molybdopterin molybdotransferase